MHTITLTLSNFVREKQGIIQGFARHFGILLDELERVTPRGFALGSLRSLQEITSQEVELQPIIQGERFEFFQSRNGDRVPGSLQPHAQGNIRLHIPAPLYRNAGTVGGGIV